MKKALLALFISSVFAGVAAAQSAPAAEAFIGYSFVRADGGENFPGGWHGSIAGNFNKNFGLVGEFSGHYKDFSGVTLKVHTFTFGPRFTYRGSERVEAFAHATVGGANASASAFGIGAGDTAFAWTIGGGVDIRCTDRIAVRPVQLDYVGTRFGSQTQNNLRYSAGIVFRFGSK